MPDEMPDADR
jgi:DtxR family manganese transport transcriptional regulator